MKRKTLHSYSHARARYHVAPGDAARTTVRIPTDPVPIFPPVVVTVEEISHHAGRRRKDAFGQWETSGKGTRVRVRYQGKSYWVDGDTLEKMT